MPPESLDSDLHLSDVCAYLLQAVIWNALFIQRRTDPTSAQSVRSASSSRGALEGPGALASTKHKKAHRLSGAIAPAALLKHAGGKGDKLPERVIRRFGEHVAAVANGTDATYRDPAFQSTMSAFVVRYPTRDFQKNLGKHRRVEDLVSLFKAHAQGHLAAQLPGPDVNQQVNEQVHLFVHLLRDTVAARSGARDYFSSRNDLLDHLDSFMGGMGVPSRAPSQGRSTPSSLTPPLLSPMASVGPQTLSFVPSVLVMPAQELIKVQPTLLTAASLLSIGETQLLKDVDTVRLGWTAETVLAGLKRASCHAGGAGLKIDFDHEDGWRSWKAGEQKYYSDRIKALHESNLGLAHTTAWDAPAGGHISDADKTSSASGVPVSKRGFIPQHPEQAYRRVIKLCLDRDFQSIAAQAEDEPVELTILSKAHADLLRQVAEVWRVREQFTRLAHLQVVLDELEQVNGSSTVPLICVEAILEKVEHAIEQEPVSLWTTQEQQLLKQTLTRTLAHALAELAVQFGELPAPDLQEVYGWTELADHIHVDLLNCSEESRAVLDAQVAVLKALVERQAVREYDTDAAPALALAPTQDGQIVMGLHEQCTWLTKRVRKLSKQYPQPLLCGRLNMIPLVMTAQVTRFGDALARRRLEAVKLVRRDQDAVPFDHVFRLYDDVVELRNTLAKVCPGVPWCLDVVGWFQPHVDYWLVRTSEKTAEWVDNAVRADTFQPIDSVGAFHSSSIDDLFTALQQPVDFLASLSWPDELSLAGFKTSLARTFTRAIQQYCVRIQDVFMTQIHAQPSRAGQAEAQKQHHAWIARAKLALRENTKADLQQFVLQPATCIQLNNIEKAWQLLDTLYNKMDADAQCRTLALHSTTTKGSATSLSGPDPSATDRQRFLFTIKVVRADGLRPAVVGIGNSSALDTFVMLTNESTRTQYARTRTVYGTCEPRWGESFDIAVEEPTRLTLTVMERQMGGGQASCGRTVLKLDPSLFQILRTQSMALELETHGKVHLRVSVEKEEENILYYFGRAFRSLKRCEDDMVRAIVDKVDIHIRHYLSRSRVKALVKTHTPMSQKLDKVRNLASSSWTASSSASSESLTSPMATPSARVRSKAVELTDAEIEEEIVPLLNFFEPVLATLNENLSPEERLTVLSKIWKQVLVTLQGILMPPLSDEPTGMHPLDERHITVVMKWRLFLFDYFLARDKETNEVYGLPVNVLQTAKYRELDEFVSLNGKSTDELKLECSRVVHRTLEQQSDAHCHEISKSVINQRTLGSIKERRAQKKTQEDFSEENVILRILRMRDARDSTREYISQQLALKTGAPSALPPGKTNRTSHLLDRTFQGKGHLNTASLPKVPPLPAKTGTLPFSRPSPGPPNARGPRPRSTYLGTEAVNQPCSHLRMSSAGSPPPLPPRDLIVPERSGPAIQGAHNVLPPVPPPLPPRV